MRWSYSIWVVLWWAIAVAQQAPPTIVQKQKDLYLFSQPINKIAFLYVFGNERRLQSTLCPLTTAWPLSGLLNSSKAGDQNYKSSENILKTTQPDTATAAKCVELIKTPLSVLHTICSLPPDRHLFLISSPLPQPFSSQPRTPSLPRPFYRHSTCPLIGILLFLYLCIPLFYSGSHVNEERHYQP